MKKYFPFILLAFIYCLMSSAGAQTVSQKDIINFGNADSIKEEDKILAKVGNINVTTAEFLYGYEFGPAFVKKEKDSKKRYLKYLINEKLLANEGYLRGLDKTERFKSYYNAINKDLVTEELYRQEVMKYVKITDGEIDKGMKEKLITLNIKWLYGKTEKEIADMQKQLKSGVSFDSLFNMQINDSVFVDERSMEIDRYQLGRKNPLLAGIIDSMKAGGVSLPIHTSDGWYIVKVDNLWREVIPNETQVNKYKYDVKTTLEKAKMDSISDVYVDKTMTEESPVIKNKIFTMLRSYIGKSCLENGKYGEWKLEKKLKMVIDSLKNVNPKEYKNLELVKLKNSTITLNDFLLWFRIRSESIKLNQTSLKAFSISLESIVWRMVRDELMVKKAYAQGLENSPAVKEQSRWWKDKVMFAVIRDELGKAISVADEIKTKNDKENRKEKEFTEKLLHKINKLKQNTKIEINNDILARIKVEQENDEKAIEVYTVKAGGYFPHQAYPSIDLYWRSWE